MYQDISDPGIGSYRPRVALALFSSPSQSAISRWGWGFHTVRGGFDPGDHRVRPRVVGVVDSWNYFSPGDGDLSSPGAARSWGFLEGQLLPCAPRPLIGRGKARGSPRPMGLGLGKRWDESNLPNVF